MGFLRLREPYAMSIKRYDHKLAELEKVQKALLKSVVASSRLTQAEATAYGLGKAHSAVTTNSPRGPYGFRPAPAPYGPSNAIRGRREPQQEARRPTAIPKARSRSRSRRSRSRSDGRSHSDGCSHSNGHSRSPSHENEQNGSWKTAREGEALKAAKEWSHQMAVPAWAQARASGGGVAWVAGQEDPGHDAFDEIAELGIARANMRQRTSKLPDPQRHEQAEEAGWSDPYGDMAPRSPPTFDEVDRNGDGVVDRSEWDAAMRPRSPAEQPPKTAQPVRGSTRGRRRRQGEVTSVRWEDGDAGLLDRIQALERSKQPLDGGPVADDAERQNAVHTASERLLRGEFAVREATLKHENDVALNMLEQQHRMLRNLKQANAQQELEELVWRQQLEEQHRRELRQVQEAAQKESAILSTACHDACHATMMEARAMAEQAAADAERRSNERLAAAERALQQRYAAREQEMLRAQTVSASPPCLPLSASPALCLPASVGPHG